jgi:hypothetical protein
MPSRQVLERQRAAREAATQVTVNIGLRPFNVDFQIFLSQLVLIPTSM